jgi:hypothetical protein
MKSVLEGRRHWTPDSRSDTAGGVDGHVVAEEVSLILSATAAGNVMGLATLGLARRLPVEVGELSNVELAKELDLGTGLPEYEACVCSEGSDEAEQVSLSTLIRWGLMPCDDPKPEGTL